MKEAAKKQATFNLNKTDFHKHMREKKLYWDPWKVFFGEDFCVFEFEFMFEHDNAKSGAVYWLDSYNYSLTSDGKDRFVIINKTEKPDSEESDIPTIKECLL